MGTSDIHGLIDWDHHVPYGHRPITIVFAKEKNEEAIHDGLNNRRTVVVHNNILIGRDEYLKPLVEAWYVSGAEQKELATRFQINRATLKDSEECQD